MAYELNFMCCSYNLQYAVKLDKRKDESNYLVSNNYNGEVCLATFVMEMHLKYDIHIACKVILQDLLKKLKIPYSITESGSVEIIGMVPEDKSKRLKTDLMKYGIELIDNSQSLIVQKIKDAIHIIVYRKNRPSHFKLSEFVSDKLNLSYSYLSKVFTDEMNCSIENYMIIQRIERVKQLVTEDRMTVTEIAWKLNFSSVAHLSNQFKKITGLTPTVYQRNLINSNLRKNNYRKDIPV